MKKIFGIIALVVLLFSACDEDTMELGYSIVSSNDSILVSTSVFNVDSKTVVIDSVLARNGETYLGKVRDDETDSYLTSSFATQFHIVEGLDFPPVDSFALRDPEGKLIVDSVFVSLTIESFYGDSLNQMQATLYELARPLEEDVQYYSNLNLEAQKYIRFPENGGIVQTAPWTTVDLSSSDSVRRQYYCDINIPLPNEYIDSEGERYNNYGTYLLRKCYENPQYLKNSYEFIHHICPGFYIDCSNGIGTMAKIMNTELSFIFKAHPRPDSIATRLFSLEGTSEVLQLSCLENDITALNTLASDKSCTWLKTPAGLFTEYTLPVQEIYMGHDRDSINAASMTIPFYNKTDKSKYALPSPNYLLMIETDSLKSFFEKSKNANGDDSFICTKTTNKNCYSFDNISDLITKMNNEMKKGVSKDPSWIAKHPNWNKVVVVPVSVTTNTSGEITQVRHNLSMTSVRLVGGANNPLEPIQMKIIYSKFKTQ